jgi:hypothetical protein
MNELFFSYLPDPLKCDIFYKIIFHGRDFSSSEAKNSLIAKKTTVGRKYNFGFSLIAKGSAH